jgi:hypothetical protein
VRQLHADGALDVSALAEELVEIGVVPVRGLERLHGLVDLAKQGFVLCEPAVGRFHHAAAILAR